MIAFKDITIQDKDTITAYTMNSCRRNCDLSFPTYAVGGSCITPSLPLSITFWFSNSGPAMNWPI